MGLDASRLPKDFTDKMVVQRGKLPPAAGTVTMPTEIVNPMDKLNATEKRCYDYLVASGLYTQVRPHVIRLWLGHRCTYTPDFFCDGRLSPVIVECKGDFKWEDSWIKFKTAVTLFPSFTFLFMEWNGKNWKVTKYS